jgi:PHS family inorganic phosphate transporter-like MFS transporter
LTYIWDIPVWRIIVGLSLIPAFGTLYQRLTLPESTRYEESQRQRLKLNPEAGGESIVLADSSKGSLNKENVNQEKHSPNTNAEIRDLDNDSDPTDTVVKKKAHFKEFVRYFSEWRHLKLLIGTSVCWFLLDIAFYGINLNQNVVLEQIGFDGSSGTPWEMLFKIGTGNIIITALGFVPGYYATVLTIEIIGRKWIQIQGFLVTSLFRKSCVS